MKEPTGRIMADIFGGGKSPLSFRVGASRVVASLACIVPRPRRIETPAVSALAGEITDQLSVEVRRHGHA